MVNGSHWANNIQLYQQKSPKNDKLRVTSWSRQAHQQNTTKTRPLLWDQTWHSYSAMHLITMSTPITPKPFLPISSSPNQPLFFSPPCLPPEFTASTALLCSRHGRRRRRSFQASVAFNPSGNFDLSPYDDDQGKKKSSTFLTKSMSFYL